MAFGALSGGHKTAGIANTTHPRGDTDGHGEDEREQCQEFLGLFHMTSQVIMMWFFITSDYLKIDFLSRVVQFIFAKVLETAPARRQADQVSTSLSYPALHSRDGHNEGHIAFFYRNKIGNDAMNPNRDT